MSLRHGMAALVAAVMMMATTPGRSAAGNRPGTVPAPGGDPKLKITTDRNTGFSPLSVTITGEMRGLAEESGNFCHPRVIWTVWDTSRDLYLRSATDPRCLHRPDRTEAPFFFRKAFTLPTGSHMARLSSQGKDGRLISSNYVHVEVH